MFDDGYNCKNPNYSIFHKNNFVTSPLLGTSTFLRLKFSKFDLNWEGEESYFLSFSLQLEYLSLQNYF